MPVGAGLHQIDGVMIDAAAQEREEIAHPVGNAETQHVAIELRDVLHVGDVEGDVAELVRNDALARKFLVREVRPLEHLHDGALRVLEHDGVGNGRLGIALARGLDAVRGGLALEGVEILVDADLKAEMHAFGRRAPAQDHRMMVDGVGEIDGAVLLADDGQPEDVGVIFRLLVQVGRLVAGMSDLAYADHVMILH